MPDTKLPLTHYDRIHKLRPWMWELLEKDVAKLATLNWGGTISSVDDFGSTGIEQAIDMATDEILREVAERTGLPKEILRNEFRRQPQYTALLTSLNLDYHTFLNFERAGRKTFFFSENLTEHLLVTELDIEAERLHAPFESCLFVFPGATVVDTLYASRSVAMDPDDRRYPVSVFITELKSTKNEEGRNLMMYITHWRGSQARLGIKRELAIRPGWSIHEVLSTDWDELGESSGKGMSGNLTTGEMSFDVKDASFYEDGAMFYRLVLNAMLYLGSSDPELVQRLSGRTTALAEAESIKSHLKAKKARQEARKESELDFVSAGESVQPIYIDKREAQGVRPDGPGGFVAYAKRFLVRGHWRNQACGEGRMDRRLTWIRPYHKGPEMAEIVSRPYKVT